MGSPLAGAVFFPVIAGTRALQQRVLVFPFADSTAIHDKADIHFLHAMISDAEAAHVSAVASARLSLSYAAADLARNFLLYSGR